MEIYHSLQYTIMHPLLDTHTHVKGHNSKSIFYLPNYFISWTIWEYWSIPHFFSARSLSNRAKRFISQCTNCV